MLSAHSLTACAQSSAVPTLSIDAAASRTPINPDIYGIASYGLDATLAAEIAVPNVRWGGDGTSRYNWTVDSSNAGFDWYFMGGSGATTAPTPGASADLMITTYKPAKANALITIPILPYVNKSYAWSCSFPVSIYGPQTSTNPYVFPRVNGVAQTCGNSISTNGSTQLLDGDILANHIANSATLQQGWVQHLVNTFGTAAAGGVKYYQLDNEPLGWSNTHRDVQPTPAPYSTIVQLGQTYAAAVKHIDASALILGPSDFTLGGWVGTAGQQGGLWAGQYYLQQMAAYEQNNHVRILDYFDEHYYFDTSTPAAQLAATRTLWDPTYNGGTWVEQYDFDGPMQLIPRFKNWIDTYYPGTKLSFSEYSIDSGKKSIVDAIAEMDVLGIYGREQLDFANMWSPPAPTDPIAFAFRMFRNYDGNGHRFGDTSISAVSSDPGALSVYAAQRSSDNALTILVINKTTTAITTALALANVSLPSVAQAYTYSAANLASIVQSSAPIAAASIPYTFPSYAAVLFIVQPSPLPTQTTLTASPTPAVAGATVSFSVTVTASGSAPSGTVALLDGGNSLGTASLANGAASFAFASLAPGSHAITASYAGNSTDAASSATVTLPVDPAPVPTTTTLSVTPAAALVGQAVSMSAAVTAASGAVAAGSITFDDGNLSLGTVTLEQGAATMSVSALSVGTHALTAHYSGDSGDLESVSPAVSLQVSAASGSPPAPPDYTLSLSGNTVEPTSTQSAALEVTVAPQNGFSGVLSFACSGLPAGWMCSFAPPTLAVGASASTTLTVHAVTGSQTQAPLTRWMAALMSPGSLILIGFAGNRRRCIGVLGLSALAMLLFGCGGGDSGSGTSAPPPIAAATYTVTVTASGSSAPSHTQVFTLAIQGT